jgi:RNA polymerase sigma factor (sigma-70 family)
MAGEPMSALLHHLHRVLNTETARQLTDAEALQRFTAQQDESAFAALMQRHGPLVLNVCRHFLRHEQDAEDAFQATFLVLARQASSIRKERSVANWLYGVAYRVAMKARRSAARRRLHESQAPVRPENAPPSDLGWRDLQALLDEELNHLPDKYRRPFVLCCLASRSKKEAAEELGWKEGTVSSRLAQARKILQARLARRGVALSALLAGLAVARQGSAAVPSSLAASTLQAGLFFAAGGPYAATGASARAVVWAQAVLRAMALARWRLPAVLLLLAVLVSGGAAALLPRPTPPPPPPAAAPPPEGPREEGARPAPAPKAGGAADAPGDTARGRLMTVTGRVEGPDGAPVAKARVLVLSAQYRRSGEPDLPSRHQLKVLGSGTADNQGRFRLQVPQTTSWDNYRVTALASAPGYAPNYQLLDRVATTHAVYARLERGQSVRGRWLGPRGEPARGVRVHVTALYEAGYRGFNFRFQEPPGRLPVWPDPVTTDDKGNFVLTGLGANLQVDVEVRDERYATQRLTLSTAPGRPLRLAPPRLLEGRITAADTGLPLANVRLSVWWEGADAGGLLSGVAGRTDAAGRFRLRPFPGQQLSLRVYPPGDSPYLSATKTLRWPAGAERFEVSLALRRGVLVRGRVTEEGSGRPVPDAEVLYAPDWVRGTFPGATKEDPSVAWWPGDARAGADGSFALAVPPGPGHLLFRGGTPDYLHVETTDDQLARGRPGGKPYFPDAVVPIAPRPGVEPPGVSVTLRRGVTLRGRVVGRDGKPLAAGLLISPTHVPRGWEVSGAPLPVHDGRFELPGCDPNKAVPAWFYDARGQQGAYVELRAGADREPVVRLVPCRRARVRFVDRAGEPLAHPRAMLDLVLRPGAPEEAPKRDGPVRVLVPGSLLYGPTIATLPGTGAGVFLPPLIPGAPHALRAEAKLGWPVQRTFTVPPGRGTLDLGDVTIDSPPPRRP